MKVVDKLDDIHLYIEYMLCFNFKDIKTQSHIAVSFNTSKFKDGDIVIALFDDYKCKRQYSKLNRNSRGHYIDILGFRCYLNEKDIIKIMEATSV